MINNTDIDQFMSKIKKLEKGEQLDLSSDEDLSIAIMNLISIEEHLFFSGNKTGDNKYFDLINEIREMRKGLLKMIIKDYEGEVWCISKHLLAASMRLMEVGTKAQTKGNQAKANELFKKSYDLYNLFWGLNLGMVKNSDLKSSPSKALVQDIDDKEAPISYSKNEFLGKVSSVIGKILDCCRE
ncbi:MAG: hypothetical protein Q8P53_03120 [Candidatus Shapirobacteria bacterium]|nr:hypothetical protein [Candidatus Shapirobacteria bacterium]